MHHTTFDTFVRRAASLQVQVRDRRSFLGGLSAALLAATGLPLATEAKKGKNKQKRDQKLAKRCRRNLPGFCEGNQQCLDELNPCCRFLAKGKRGKADACCRESEFCPGASSLTGIG